ncbi:type VI secretion system protein TssL, short form [Providencia alcalifaciens]|jgi:type VI secretion system protein ImpK|uniref:type VI secretion system protein TssL, short form n=1 Tax=Providencia TaxID=586 RepID=UPI000D3BE0E1|nr:type VI secretion system protein TssL, short form [Providencia alcalifaciens]MBG5882501.1 DotU family type IV/VI secretion system protein [Providencia alcalifaciens]MDR2242412.1 type VI secretion system protein TssL, short form [Providencia alcalifaciens]
MNNTTSHHTIDMIFAQTWLMVCQLHQGTAITHGDSFYRRVCQLIDETRQKLLEHGYPESAIEHMQYAQCALIDESVMNRQHQDDGYNTWIQSPLQARYFNTLEAGDKLWDRLRSILNETAPNPDVLLCFHRVLTLGFVGKFRQKEAPERERIVAQLNVQLPDYLITSELPLVVKPKLRFSRRRLYWFGWIGGILILAAMWWGFSASLEHLLQQWMTQG